MYYQTGKNEQSIEALRQALRLKPELFVPNLFLGLNYVTLKRFREAIPYLQYAAVAKPAEIQAQLALGQAYVGTGDTRRAIQSYLRATQLEPGNADAWYHLGVRYLEQVEANARIMLTRHKDSSYLQALMADNFSDQWATIQAAEAYKKALSAPPFPSGTHARYGFVLLNQHDLPNAEREFHAELASTPGSLMGKLGLARWQVEQGAAEKGAAEIAHIAETDITFLRANAPMFMAGLGQTKLSEFQRVLEQGQAAGEVSPELVALFRDNPIREADSQGSMAHPDHPVLPAKNSRLAAAALYASGKYERCAKALAPRVAVLQIKELRLLASCGYATADYRATFDAAGKLAVNAATEAEGLYWETKSAQKLASASLAQASELDSSSPKLHVLLGDVYRQQKNFPEAEQEYRKALALRPEDTGALFGLSLALLANSEIDEALQLAQAALVKNPDDPELNAVMGEILCARDDYLGAEPFLKKSLNTKPEFVSRVHALLGNVYAKTNRTQEAITELKLALASDKDGSLHYQIARLYLKVGDRESANQAFAVTKQIQQQGLVRAAVAVQQGEQGKDPQ